MNDRDVIYSIINSNIEYHKNSYITSDYLMSQKIAYELGFSDYVADIIRSVFLRIMPTGDVEKDSQKYTEEIIKSIWIV